MDPTPAANPVRFTSGDEAANSKQIIQNIEQEAFKDWPNDAGVSVMPFLSLLALRESCLLMIDIWHP